MFSFDEEYSAPTAEVIGTVNETTLGSAGNDKKDDTQYWE